MTVSKKIKIVFGILAAIVAFLFIFNQKERYLSDSSSRQKEREHNFYKKTTENASAENENILAKIGKTPILLEIADSHEKRELGLSYREFLSPHEGLFFIFDKNDYRGIWMKEMKFSIDVIWLDENLKITDIQENISPDSYPSVFMPRKKSLHVLEVNSGFVNENNIAVGDSLFFLESAPKEAHSSEK